MVRTSSYVASTQPGTVNRERWLVLPSHAASGVTVEVVTSVCSRSGGTVASWFLNAPVI